MRPILVLSLLAGLAFAHPCRKTLGFGPEHPHAVFHSSPYQIHSPGFRPLPTDTDPIKVANSFATALLNSSGQLNDDVTYRIRKDSYTDKNTGVSHLYLRQVIHGLEVADGDMNINVKDGIVISYGSSFYNGHVPSPSQQSEQDPPHPHRDFCNILLSQLDDRQAELDAAQFLAQGSNGQTPLRSSPSDTRAHVVELSHLANSNCRFYNLADEIPFSSAGDITDFRHPLLQFMIAATPNDDVVADILDNYEGHVAKMVETPTHELLSSGSSIEFSVDNVPDTVNPVKARLAYVQVPNKERDGTLLQLVWKFEVEMQDNWYEAAVSATAPHRIISVVDWASDAPPTRLAPIPRPASAATYNVFAWGVNDPTEGNRTLEKESFDAFASPAGWHALPYGNDPMYEDEPTPPSAGFWHNTTTTWGNNVHAHENWDGKGGFVNNRRPDVGPGKVFDFPYDPKERNSTDALEEAKSFIDSSVTQLFYTTNMVHDLYYRYGFDEVSGNFQAYNFERGGQENDAVIANAQDGSGMNNANFMTPPDGQNGKMRMYLWNTANPYRDGDLEAGIVIHELSHGLSTRLTGGPANSGCLGWGESGGMGEGWGDFLATTIRRHENYSDYPMGAWAANRDDGIRNYPYSLDKGVNPSMYKTLDKPGYWGVHAIGEVWAEMLWVVLDDMIKEHGYSDNLFPPQPTADGSVPAGDFYRPSTDGSKVPKHGNTLMVQLVLNAMKLQPCRPGFFDARDAIIQADNELTGGENFCTLWKGFAKRGLGKDATVEGRTPWGGGIRTNGLSSPRECE